MKPYEEVDIHGEAREKINQAWAKLSHQLPTADPSSFRNALFRIELRREIHKAFKLKRPPRFSVEWCGIDRTFGPTDDWVWMQRVIAYTADIMTYSFGVEEPWEDIAGEMVPTRWHALTTNLHTLMTALPQSFQPYYEDVSDPRGRLFKMRWYMSDCHGMGLPSYSTFKLPYMNKLMQP